MKRNSKYLFCLFFLIYGTSCYNQVLIKNTKGNSSEINIDKYFKDSLNFVFNQDSFNYYYQIDTTGFRSTYLEIESKKLIDTASYYFYVAGNNDDIGCKCLLSGIKRNYPDAFAFLGGLILNEGRCSKNYYKGFLYLVKSTYDKSEQGIMNLANYYYTSKQLDKVVKFYKYGDSLDMKMATFNLSYIYFYGKKFATNDTIGFFNKYLDKLDKGKGLKMFINLAERGNYLAQYELAVIYMKTDKSLAFKYLIMAYLQDLNNKKTPYYRLHPKV